MKITEIQLAVCEEFGISISNLLARNRKRAWSWPRHVAMGLSREMTEESLPRLAKAFRKKDHTTIMHGIKNYQKLLEDEDWAARIYAVEKRLKNV